ncbi:MAG: virulence protein RhuM/Fic/DOC family protein [Patescibacteria group bacterium]
MKKKINNSGVIIYQAKNGAIELRGDIRRETVWATQAQISDIFCIERSVVTRHIRNILSNGEVMEKSNVQKMHIAHSDKPIALYSLDMILAVGYRANSNKAIEFRKWASKILRKYVIGGYAINRVRISKNYGQFLEAVESIKALLPADSIIDHANVLELVSAFANTWVSLEAYDEDRLIAVGATKKNVAITAGQLSGALLKFKQELIKNGEASELFGIERHEGSVAGIVGNIMQTFGGKPLYKSVEEKAAHLLYFIVKDHPLVDGNKRSGAYAFIWFLKKAGILYKTQIMAPALTALTLFVAESDPKNKARMIRIILQLLKK